MKHSTIAKSALALALGMFAGSALAVTTTTVSENFESYDVGTAASALTTKNLTWTDADGYSEVVAGKKLSIDAADSPTTATIADAARVNPASFTATVSFTPATTAQTVDDTGADLKFALYAYTADGTSTNLYVIEANGTATDTGLAVGAGEHVLAVTFPAAGQFSVSLDGTASAGNPFSFKNSGSISKVEFQGNGTVDNIALMADDNWTLRLGAAVDGAYTIDNEADLIALKDGVAAGLTTAGVTFKQTANIDMTSAGAFAGIGTFNKIPTAGTPFLGTYDGQGYTIANVTRAGGNTQGIFNQVGPSGVIENLVVSNMVFDAELTGEYGFAIVGNAGGGATLRNLTAAGVFGAAGKASTHNMAGIVVRLSPGATAGAATTIDSCTNNATIYGGYTKLGGINAIVQNQTGFADGKVVFVNCANNGTLVCKRTAAQAAQTNGAVTGNAGIVGYIAGTNVELTGCYGNGAITNADGANTDKDGALVGWTYGGTIKDNGGNSAPDNKKMIGTWGSATETGFLYATVANDIATTISGSPVAGGSYLLEGDAAPVIALADGQRVSFNTALGYALTDSGITASGEGIVVTSATVGTVTTYTAGPAVHTYVADESVEADDGTHTLSAGEADYLNAIVAANGNDTAANTALENALADMTAGDFEEAYLLNQDIVAANGKGTYTFGITDVTCNGTTVTVTVELDRSNGLTGINGTLNLKVSEDGGKTFGEGTSVTVTDADFSEGTTTTITLPVSGNGKVFKATIQ